jgi:hypothetical protein
MRDLKGELHEENAKAKGEEAKLENVERSGRILGMSSAISSILFTGGKKRSDS